MSRTGVLLTIAYDGSAFAGFAPQPAQRTIHGELLKAVRAVDPDVTDLRGASRTDAGVHAIGQRVAFDTALAIPPRGWAHALVRHLPDDLSIRRASTIAEGFSPRFSNRGKRYRYVLLRDRLRDPFFERRAWRLAELDDAALERLRVEAGAILGTHDFAAFRSSADERTETTRTIRAVDVTIDPSDTRVVRVDFEGTAFLHNMIRILVGTLVDVARGRLEAGAVERALATKDRRSAGITAPPDGLYLERVLLDDEGSDAYPQ